MSPYAVFVKGEIVVRFSQMRDNYYFAERESNLKATVCDVCEKKCPHKDFNGVLKDEILCWQKQTEIDYKEPYWNK